MRSKHIRATKQFMLFVFALALSAPATVIWAQGPDETSQIATEVIAEGLDQPLFVTHAGDERLFALEKPGVIQIIQNGKILPTPFLDIRDLVVSDASEQGIFGLAFHPDYPTNGHFYVSYSSQQSDGAFVLARYERSETDPDQADPQSAAVLLDIEHRRDNHYGGMLAFGPDGYLYVSTGDGGGAYDPDGNGQNLETLLGKLLRLDVNGDEPYAIPADNPFVGVENAREEIWAYGLRNAWRFSFDQLTGDLYIADVGQERFEEVNLQPADSIGGENYGWPITEGSQCLPAGSGCDASGFILPIAEYPHADGENFLGCSVTGGYVYRGNPASLHYGTYFYSDYCTGTIWSLDQETDGEWQSAIALETSLTVSSFGVDFNGEIYLADLVGGQIHQLTLPDETPEPVAPSLQPAVIAAGGASCVATVSWIDVSDDSTVRWNGEDLPTTRTGPDSLSFTIDSHHIAEPGTAQVVVATRGSGIDESPPAPLEIVGGLIEGQAIANTWERTDYPVREGLVSRTWIWGPAGMFCATSEPYLDTPGGTRAVQYFDKARMEVNDPSGDSGSIWYVTNGLLVTEMITGQMQTGDAAFEPREPSAINLAGDLDDIAGPTYATFERLLDLEPHPTGSAIVQRIDRAGNITQDDTLAQYGVLAAMPAPDTGHTVAGPFWEFMTSSAEVWQNGALVNAQLFENPFYATGLPISEAYWTTVRVAGTQQDVLVQAFERRVLTYTPANEPGWQVELGNVGQHYYFWRYGEFPFPPSYGE
ncbi:MAG: PQQ-dependent sugar dehydrogenase [Chloroflexia bacterium]|nr:PQQ-dependent sugar dehydrogenase [Chloroflexia bacterium]